jgi:LysR family transcriptional regulator for bpeEF and oprC
VLRHLQSGELREVLTQWPSSPIPISIMYLHNRHLSPKVRAFVDWAAELFGRCPLLNGRENDEGADCPYFLQQGKNTMSALIEEENII